MTGAKVDTMKARSDEKKDNEILDWLMKNNYDPQESYISKRQPGTGQWFLESDDFQNWLKADNQTLFCPGIPGAGKSFMTSIVVEYLRNNYPSSCVAYVYCHSEHQEEQTPTNMLRSILRQLVWNKSPLPKEVRELHDAHNTRIGSQPQLAKIALVLKSVIASNARTFIVIDALDECQNNDSSRDILLSELLALQEATGLNVFATSRHQEVEANFNGSLIQEISATTTDIEIYLEEKITMWEKLHNSDLKNIRQLIKRELVQAADGM